MSCLRNLAAAIKANVDLLEAQLATDGAPNEPLFLNESRASFLDEPTYLPPVAAFHTMEKLRVDLRALESAITPTRLKLANVAMLTVKTSALEVASELGVADHIDAAGGSATLGTLANALSTYFNAGHVLRVLTAENIFVETSLGTFSNNRHSRGLLSKEKSRPMLSLLAQENARAALSHRQHMTSSESKHSFSPDLAPFSLPVAQGRLSFLEWLTKVENASALEKVTSGVPWLNSMTRSALIQDFPWDQLSENVSVVDLGCGPGDAGLDLVQRFSNLRWNFQDLPHVIGQTKQEVRFKAPARLLSRMAFHEQDYFNHLGVQGDVYFIRGVIREYDDDQAQKVLRRIAEAMASAPHKTTPRLLINEIFCPSPIIVQDPQSPRPLSESVPDVHQSAMAEWANLMAMNAFNLFGGCERSFSEVEKLVNGAGLRVVKYFPLRTFTGIIECRLQ